MLDGSPLEPLTYHASFSLRNFQKVVVPFRNRTAVGTVIERTSPPAFKTLHVGETLPQVFKEEQILVARFIAEYYICSLGEALALMIPHSIQSDDVCSCDFDFDSHIDLAPKQQSALTFLQQHRVALLFGDTGSGKTEIYMKYFEMIGLQKKQSLFLMPEISLTPQMHSRLEKQFGDTVVMWHSKLTKKQKEKALEKLHSGDAMVVAGPRSALFLPFLDLGLIVVDEEHDDSYKSSSRPRYNARDIAIYTGKIMDIPVVLGSATPSLTSYVKFPSFRLKGGYFQSRRNFLFEEHPEAITPNIQKVINNTFRREEQGIVFIPTRANFKYLICDSCGFTYECPYCSVGMSLHRNSRSVKCHYCNYSEPIPQQCPKCRQGALVSSRIGTAEAVEQLQEALPALRIEQFDRDAITTQKKLISALQRFNDRETDLLVGTQMLSKGHDYHGVTLAVVLGLDNILNLSDYRARERALSMLMQIAGRSGRKKEATVVVQSYHKEFFMAYMDGYENFLEDEKSFREGMYPPYKKLCRLLFAHKNGIKAKNAMEDTVQCIKRYPHLDIVGYGPSPIEKIAGKYRFQILMRSDRSTDLIRAIKACSNEIMEVDMDPVEFQ